MKQTKAFQLYQELKIRFGDPGPWPWFELGRERPHTPEEIVIGAVLTQNTSWRNVELALSNLCKARACSLNGILRLGKGNGERLKAVIRPAGFYQQKSKTLLTLCCCILQEFGTLDEFFRTKGTKLRTRLLAINGIGKETADTILLYAGEKPFFVIDTYTKRFVRAMKLTQRQEYDALQIFFQRELPKSVKVYQSYHALIVAWGKVSR